MQDPSTGKWKDQSETFRGTKAKAEAKLAEGLNAIDKSTYVEPSKSAVRDFLTRWLRDYVAVHITKDATKVSYTPRVNKHLIPVLGAIPLTKLTPAHVQELYRVKLDEGLSTTTVRGMHLALRSALESAVRLGMVARNVCDATTPPKRRHVDYVTWTADECRTLLEAAKSNRYCPLFATALYTGMRLGEILGLRWQDVDLDQGVIRVVQTLEKVGLNPRFGTPKSAKSRRTLPIAPELVSTLRTWKAQQNEERLLLGADYRDLGLIFTIPGGAPINGDNLRNQTYARLVALTRVRRVRPHDLRHCYASTLLAAGVPLKVVSELLGHSSVSITGDIYGHLTLDTKREAVNVLGCVFSLASS